MFDVNSVKTLVEIARDGLSDSDLYDLLHDSCDMTDEQICALGYDYIIPSINEEVENENGS